MVTISDAIINRSRDALAVLSRFGQIRAAYLFGSQAEGRADRWSDIDIAAFIEGVEDWDIRQRAKTMARVQRECGADIEVHLFAASACDNPPPASFAAFILSHGVPLTNRPQPK
jgi:predicted nucleotidyltransferase